MAKLTLTDITSLVSNPTSAVTNINANSALIEAAMENTLSRDGTVPNQMAAELDMNSNRIINLPQPLDNTEPLRLGDLKESSQGLGIASQAEAEAGTSNTVLMTPLRVAEEITAFVQSTNPDAFTEQVANTVFSGPSSGVDALPTFRSLVSADIPTTLSSDRVFSGNVNVTKLGTGVIENNVVLNAYKSDSTVYATNGNVNTIGYDIVQIYNPHASADQASIFFRAQNSTGRFLLNETGASKGDFVWQLRNGAGTTPEVMRLRSNGSLDVGSFDAVLGYNVLNYGADPTGGTDSVAAFQAAIDATTNSGICIIHIPAGTYAGDMTTLNIGSRGSVTFVHHGKVVYSGTAPVQAGNVSSNNINLMYYAYSGDSTRPWMQGEFSIGKSVDTVPAASNPLLRIQQDTGYSGGSLSEYDMVSLSLNINKDNASNATDRHASGFTVTTTCGRTGAVNLTTAIGANLYSFKTHTSNTNLFGSNIVCRDQTTRKSSVSLGAMTGLEIDLVCSGPDDNDTRTILDVVGRGYQSSTDGATSVSIGVSIRPANVGTKVDDSISNEPLNLETALYIDPGSLGSITTGVWLGDMTTGINIGGDMATGIAFNGTYSSAAISLQSDNYIALNDGLTLFWGYDSGANRVTFKSSSTEKIGFNLGATPAIYVAGTKVLSVQKTGWTAATGTATRTTFATGSVTTSALAEHVKALIDDLMSHGLIGA